MATALIEVRIWGQQVGAVARDDTVGAYVFEYAPTWRRRGIELAPLLMPVTGTQAKFAFPSLSEPAFRRLPGMLADALPDDFGNALIDAWMARQGVDKNQVTALDRLAYMGKRGMGALEFRPAKGAHRESHEPLPMKQLVETARQGRRRLEPADRRVAQWPIRRGRRIRALASEVRRGGQGPGAGHRCALRTHRVRLSPDGLGRWNRDERLSTTGGKRPCALHDKALRSRRQQETPRAIAVRDAASRLQAARHARL